MHDAFEMLLLLLIWVEIKIFKLEGNEDVLNVEANGHLWEMLLHVNVCCFCMSPVIDGNILSIQM